MQILGPQAKGKKETWLFVAFETPSLNLSGLNSAASFPHSWVSRWTSIVGRLMWTPPGSVRSPSFISLWMARFTWVTGGYSLRTSLIIIVIWKRSKHSAKTKTLKCKQSHHKVLVLTYNFEMVKAFCIGFFITKNLLHFLSCTSLPVLVLA